MNVTMHVHMNVTMHVHMNVKGEETSLTFTKMLFVKEP
jgi:hypothetical protein